MRNLSQTIAVTSLLLAAGCAQQPVTSLQKGAEHIVVSTEKAAPRADAEFLGTVTGKDGNGCRGFGHIGVQELAEIDMRNQAAAMGGDFVQIESVKLPGNVEGHCRTNEYSVVGKVFRTPGAMTLEQRLARGGPLVLAPRPARHEEPNFQPPAMKPRELRAPNDRERVLEAESGWKKRELVRYVSVYSEEGRAILDGVPLSKLEEDKPKAIPGMAAQAPAKGMAAVSSAPRPAAAPAAAQAPVTSVATAAPVVPVAEPEPVATLPPLARAASPVVAPAEVPVPAEQSVSAMPVPVLAPQTVGSMPTPASASTRQITLSPNRTTTSAAPAASMTREERERALEELARDTSLSYQEYQRRYREIMGN